MIRFNDLSPRLAARLAALALCAVVTATAQSTAIEVSLDNLSQVYSGGAKVPLVTTVPAGSLVDLVYRKIGDATPPVSEVAFNNVPNTLSLTYSSLSFSAQKVNGLGNYLRLGGSGRKLETCDVTMVTWATAASYPTWAGANSSGYNHPVTLTFYRVTATNQLAFLTEVEKSIFVPWRPLTLSNGTAYPHNGYAFNVTFAFPNGITLPEKVLALVSYNTQSTGFAPIGVQGPYNELNVALGSSGTPVSVGSDADPGAVLKIVYSPTVQAGIWEFPNTSLRASEIPLIRLRALSTHTKIAPVNAGSYEISGSISDSSFAPRILGTMVVNKASAELQISNVQQFYTGASRPVDVATLPTGLPVTVQYAGAAEAPAAIGTYPVTAQVVDPNYLGSASALLAVSPSFLSWIGDKVSAGVIRVDQSGDHDDPDGDNLSNLMEYALGLDPAVPFGGSAGPLPPLPLLQFADGGWTFSYRRNAAAADVSFVIEHCQSLTGSETWAPFVGNEVIVNDDGQTRFVKVALPTPPSGSTQFYRLGFSR